MEEKEIMNTYTDIFGLLIITIIYVWVNIMENDLYYHSKIKFKVLRETKKAVLVKMISCKSPEANNFFTYHKIMMQILLLY